MKTMVGMAVILGNTQNRLSFEIFESVGCLFQHILAVGLSLIE